MAASHTQQNSVQLNQMCMSCGLLVKKGSLLYHHRNKEELSIIPTLEQHHHVSLFGFITRLMSVQRC